MILFVHRLFFCCRYSRYQAAKLLNQIIERRACKTGGGSQTDFIIDLLDDGKQVFSA